MSRNPNVPHVPIPTTKQLVLLMALGAMAQAGQLRAVAATVEHSRPEKR
ncbi:hypothetical protein [Williamsia sp.]